MNKGIVFAAAHSFVNNIRLLILDDDPNIGRAIQSIAEEAGSQARFTIDTATFFRAVEDWHPTHIAMDLVMPEMDGLEVLGKLAERNCKARIIITSGVGSRVLDAAGRSGNERGLNIAGVLAKPFAPRALRALLLDAPDIDRSGTSGAYFKAAQINSTDSFELTEEELRRAFEMRELQLVYQPQIECASGHLAGFEALVRWMHPLHGILMPDQFIPFAEAHGLIDELTDQVLAQSIDWFVKWFPGSQLSIAVNMSARSASEQLRSTNGLPNRLKDFSLVERMRALCYVNCLDPSKVILELTETSAMEDPKSSLDFLTRLRMNGFQLSIDDFGTGYSSMVQLARLPFSEIKVDKSFVMTATRSLESRAVVKSIVDLGHSLELRVVAEGVEDADTLRYVQGVGCDLAQGYFIARPMSGDAVLGWAAREASRLRPSATQHSFL
jgi:EAL domain-containing protein (putative c-di-GMP-specific phosphodiesterase class I)/FixJ family two-component response regulator